MARKIQISISLTQEALVTLRGLMKELNLSRSAVIERCINHDLMTSENTTINHPGGITKEDLQDFWNKLNDSLVEDRQELANMIENDHKATTELIKDYLPGG